MPAALLFGAGANPADLVTRGRIPVDRGAPVRSGQYVSLVYRYKGPPGAVDAGTWARGVARALTNRNGSGTFVVASGPVEIAESPGLVATPYAEVKIRTLNSIPAGMTWSALLYALGPLDVVDVVGPWNVSADLVGAFVAPSGTGSVGGAAALADAAAAPRPGGLGDRALSALRAVAFIGTLGAVLYLAGPALRRAINRR